MNTTYRGKNLRGFSLVELILSIAIIATSLLLIIGVFTALFRSSQKSMDLTAGTVVAESVMARFLYSQQELPFGLDNLDKSGDDVTRGALKTNNNIFTYEISSQDVGTGDLRKIDVTVWWFQSPDREEWTNAMQDSREGYGKLKVKLSRLVYTKSKIQIIK